MHTRTSKTTAKPVSPSAGSPDTSDKSEAKKNGLGEALSHHGEELFSRMRSGVRGLALGQDHAAFIDSLIERAYAGAERRVGALSSFAVAAVGSYGRGAVAMGSDADVRLLTGGRRARAAAEKFAQAFLYPLWDAGLPVGHQVVDIEDALALAHRDLAAATTLLDVRHVCGDRELVERLLARAWDGMFAESALGILVDRLEEEVAARHTRFGGSLYLLEPEVKSGAGGLRDLDVVRWAARARFRVSTKNTWQELVRLGVLVAREAQEITTAEEFLWNIRNLLHAYAGRKIDRLTFDAQETMAVELGYVDSRTPAKEAPAKAPSAKDDGAPEVPKAEGSERQLEARERATAAERLMQDYYVHARVVTRAQERMLERARPPKRRGKPTETDIGRGVRMFDGQVTIAGIKELTEEPALALRVYADCVRLRAPILPFAREAIARASADAAFCEALRASPEAQQLFVDLVCTVAEVPTKRGSMVGELHDVGLLLAMIPEFSPVTGRVHHDVYHVYTVDVHSVAAVDCLSALARGELSHTHPLASRLAAEIARPKPLFLATLLHDVGKGYPDASGSRKNHSVSGAELCEVILPRLGLSAEVVAEVRALVLQHLAMYHVATRRDLDDPATIEEFCRLVRGREGLRDLYLLTVADLTTTSPTAMTSWKARMLEELYIVASASMSGHVGVDEERTLRVREEARPFFQGPPEFFDAFVSSMPERYLLANRPESIAAHAHTALERGERPVHAAIIAPTRERPTGDVAELCVVAEDMPGLVARIAAVITAARLEFVAAQVYSRPVAAGGASEAVDVFLVRGRTDGAVGVERAMPRLLRDLDDVCRGVVTPAELLRSRIGGTSPWRERPSPAVPTDIVIDDRASPRHTVIETFAKDRPGLLYTLSQALHELGLTIALSKINTEGNKVADVFYVNELDGSKVLPGERFKAIKETLARAIDSEKAEKTGG
ncbi:bifunctional uridylyltransferase/uridylyl-removing protein GlnD [Pendulispora albinea]|uniref:Bifunctional uridylyltransferase/uridylyl-removing enzyme n=1 Tax=Pendulispora albinea TaxID=2741071 RepID=A0ABZ2LKV0_9BACT